MLVKGPAPATRALIELLDHWDKGPVPESWIARHASDGTLTGVWATAPSAVWLLLVRSALGDRAAFIQSLCAAAAADVTSDAADAELIEGVFKAMRARVRALGPDEDSDAQLVRWRDTTQAMTARVRDCAPPPSLAQLRAFAGAKGLRSLGAGILVRSAQG